MYILGTFGSLLYNFLKMPVKFQPYFITQFHSLLPAVTSNFRYFTFYEMEQEKCVQVFIKHITHYYSPLFSKAHFSLTSR